MSTSNYYVNPPLSNCYGQNSTNSLHRYIRSTQSATCKSINRFEPQRSRHNSSFTSNISDSEQIPSFGHCGANSSDYQLQRLSRNSAQQKYNKKYYRSQYKYLKHHRINTQPDINYGDSYDGGRQANKCTEQEIQNRNQQKINNIDRINNKIKKILETLNEQQKKITTNSQFKLKNKSYLNRIKTEGNYECIGKSPYSELQEVKSRRGDPFSQIYEKKATNYDNQENSNNQRFKDIQKKYDCKPYQMPRNRRILEDIGNHNRDYMNGEIDGRKISFENFLNCEGKPRENNADFQKVHEERYPTSYQFKSSKIMDIDSCMHQSRTHTNYENSVKSLKSKIETPANNKSVVNTETLANINIETAANQYRENTVNQNREAAVKKTIETPAKSKYSYEARSHTSHSRVREQSTKNYDEKIEKIQERMESYEDLKKELGLEPSPYKAKLRQMVKMSHSRSKSTYSRQGSHKLNSTKQQQEKCVIDVNKITGRFPSEFSLTRPGAAQLESQLQISIPKPFKLSKRNNSTKRQIGQSFIAQSQLISEDQRFDQTNSNSFNESKRLIQSGFLNQKQRTMYNSQKSEEQSQQKMVQERLIKKFCRQIQLDCSLRDLKKWFTKKNSLYKWVELKKCIEQRYTEEHRRGNYSRGEMMSSLMKRQNLMKQIFTLAEQEDNPFYTQREEDGASLNQLIDSFIQSELYWAENIRHSEEEEMLGSMLEMIDINKKGHIVIEDLVRYINIESDEYYRNRDIYLIFKRFRGGSRTIDGSELRISNTNIVSEICRLKS